MAKKTTEKDVLIVCDEKTGEISVVAGLNADGSPKRTPAKAENAQSFLQFDRHGDVLDNFFKNFFRQCKEPSRFGFYRVAADQADKLLEVIKDLLKDPEGNKEMLAPHKVDTSGYEKKVQEEQSAEKQEQPEQKQDDEPKKQEEMERKYSINSLVYWVTYVHNVVYSFYRSMIYCYINSTQRCAGSIVIDIIPTNGADKRKFFPFAPYFPVTNVIKRYFYPYFPAIIGIKGYSFPYFPYLSGIMKIKTALYSLFSRLDWHKTVVFPCLGEIYEGIRSLSWEIPVT